MIDIDQRPIGRTPRSNPATYIKVFDEIRGFFAQLPESRVHGYKPGPLLLQREGRTLRGLRGRRRPQDRDALSRRRLRDAAKSARASASTRRPCASSYKGHSIADVLELTVARGPRALRRASEDRGPLSLLERVGLDYLHLGQPSPTLSGGEAQRIKLARELSKRATGPTLYILDEPTTGLHFDDVRKLLTVLDELVDAGNTVVVIEHNLDVIKTADWVIDLGPEGGPDGGRIVAQGTPEDVARVRGSHTGVYLQRSSRVARRARRRLDPFEDSER